ncbi:MAG TPA: ATP-binding protein [Sphingomonadaceae bacterium]|nr:ATP-binding protein [Sphingomonadaceae bacterium]
MTRPSTPRLVAAALLIVAGIALSLALGAPPAAILLALFAGAGAALLGIPRPSAPAPPPVEPERKPRRPSVRNLLEAFAEPVLIVRDRQVALANDAARSVLGAGIEGEDVRLAIRHPIVAERLIEPAAPGDDTAPAELVGVGEAERRWTMTIARLADGARLVRLEDRSSTYAAEKMRTDFVANASHELRTPLATVLGFIETLQDIDARAAGDALPDSGAATRARFLTIMDGEARRMQRLVDDLISLSRIEAERFSVPRDAHDLLTLVEQAREDQRHLSEERASPIVIDAPEGLPPVAGDRPQLLQLVDNLLANALKYGRAGTPVTVTLRVDDDDMLRLAIADQGEGIPREHLPRVTERFYRVDPSRSRAAGGTGLGLSIVKHIVERHRGRLSFSSEVGRGTTVTVALPPAASPREALSLKSHPAVTDAALKGDRSDAKPV